MIYSMPDSPLSEASPKLSSSSPKVSSWESEDNPSDVSGVSVSSSELCKAISSVSPSAASAISSVCSSGIPVFSVVFPVIFSAVFPSAVSVVSSASADCVCVSSDHSSLKPSAESLKPSTSAAITGTWLPATATHRRSGSNFFLTSCNLFTKFSTFLILIWFIC